MTTLEKAAHYSAVLKKNFGVGVPESIDLASVLDDLRAAIQEREAKILEQQRVLNKALRILQSCSETFRSNNFAYDKVIDAIEAIQENLK
jgi:RNA polymerase-interacting CarD/CdnL/TRCF family regulator